MLLDMLECTPRLGKRHTGAEGTNALVDARDQGAERPEDSLWNRPFLFQPLIALEYCFKGREELHLDRKDKVLLYIELVFGVYVGEGHIRLLDMLVLTTGLSNSDPQQFAHCVI